MQNHSLPAISGSLEQSSLPEVFRQIYLGRRTGELLIARDVIRRRVFFDRGQAIFAASNRKGDRIGAFLLRRGDISKTVFEMVDSMVPRGRRFGQMLVEMGVLTEEQMNKAVHEQVLSMIYSLFEWKQGNYEFTERSTPNLPADLKLNLSMADIILEGVGRIRDLAVLRRGMGDLNRLIAPATDPLLRMQQASLRPVEQELLEQITEPTDFLSLLVFNTQPASESIRALYGLVSAGFLTWIEAQPEITAAATESEEDLPIMEIIEDSPVALSTMTASAGATARLSPLSPATTGIAPATSLPQLDAPPANAQAAVPASWQINTEPVSAPPPAPAQSLPNNDDDESFKAELEQKRQALRSGNLYEIFEIEPSAGLEECKAAFHDLLRRFHPDKFRQSPALLREEIEYIFAEINNAWLRAQQELRSQPSDLPVASMTEEGEPVTFAENDFTETIVTAESDFPVQSNTGRLSIQTDVSEEALEAAAESHYRNGLTLLMSKRFQDAAETLRKAVHINPNKSEYHSMLALALSNSTQRNNSKICKEAEQHYLQAIRLNPKEPYHHALLGALYTRLGMARRAEAVYRQALRIDPRNQIALKGLSGQSMDAELLIHMLTRA